MDLRQPALDGGVRHLEAQWAQGVDAGDGGRGVLDLVLAEKGDAQAQPSARTLQVERLAVKIAGLEPPGVARAHVHDGAAGLLGGATDHLPRGGVRLRADDDAGGGRDDARLLARYLLHRIAEDVRVLQADGGYRADMGDLPAGAGSSRPRLAQASPTGVEDVGAVHATAEADLQDLAADRAPPEGEKREGR